MSNGHNSGGYEVGHGKPPKSTQFQKGRSGNPKGRPKGTLNIATVLARTLRERVVVNENGQRKTITKLEAALKQLANQAASGDLSAVRQLLALASSAGQRTSDAQAEHPSVNEIDREVMKDIVKQFEQSTKGDEHGSDS